MYCARPVVVLGVLSIYSHWCFLFRFDLNADFYSWRIVSGSGFNIKLVITFLNRLTDVYYTPMSLRVIVLRGNCKRLSKLSKKRAIPNRVGKTLSHVTDRIRRPRVYANGPLAESNKA